MLIAFDISEGSFHRFLDHLWTLLWHGLQSAKGTKMIMNCSHDLFKDLSGICLETQQNHKTTQDSQEPSQHLLHKSQGVSAVTSFWYGMNALIYIVVINCSSEFVNVFTNILNLISQKCYGTGNSLSWSVCSQWLCTCQGSLKILSHIWMMLCTLYTE
jgi:hypothetical protein